MRFIHRTSMKLSVEAILLYSQVPLLQQRVLGKDTLQRSLSLRVNESDAQRETLS